MESGENYDKAIMAITKFSSDFGLNLQDVDFVEFKNEMTSKKDFRL